MRMKPLFLMIAGSLCVLTLVPAMRPASAANLLNNPDFETALLAPWAGVGGLGPNATVSVLSTDNGPSAPGTHFALVDNRAQANGLTMAQSTPLGSAVAGTVFYSFDLKLVSAATGGVFFVEIFTQNAGGGVIGNAGLLGNYSPANWTTFSGSFTAPANTDHLTIQFEANTAAISGSRSTMQVDNVDLHQAPALGVPSGRAPGAEGLSLAITPNPLREGASIVLSNERSGTVEIDVLEITGRRTRQLFRGERQAGETAFRWDGKDDSGRQLEPGVYFVRVRGSEGVVTRRVALVH